MQLTRSRVGVLAVVVLLGVMLCFTLPRSGPPVRGVGVVASDTASAETTSPAASQRLSLPFVRDSDRRFVKYVLMSSSYDDEQDGRTPWPGLYVVVADTIYVVPEASKQLWDADGEVWGDRSTLPEGSLVDLPGYWSLWDKAQVEDAEGLVSAIGPDIPHVPKRTYTVTHKGGAPPTIWEGWVYYSKR